MVWSPACCARLGALTSSCTADCTQCLQELCLHLSSALAGCSGPGCSCVRTFCIRAVHFPAAAVQGAAACALPASELSTSPLQRVLAPGPPTACIRAVHLRSAAFPGCPGCPLPASELSTSLLQRARVHLAAHAEGVAAAHAPAGRLSAGAGGCPRSAGGGAAAAPHPSGRPSGQHPPQATWARHWYRVV